MDWEALAEKLIATALPAILTFLSSRGHDVVQAASTAVDTQEAKE